MGQLSLSLNAISWKPGKPVLNDISAEFWGDRLYGVIGPNGAGKSSLLRCMAGLVEPSSGEVELAGNAMSRMAPRERARYISFVPQAAQVPAGIPVVDVVKMGFTPHKKMFSRLTCNDLQALDDALIATATKGLKEQPFATLSGGEQQRVLIARSLVQAAEFKCFDEPTSHLDVHFQYQILALLQGLQGTRIVTIHDLNLAAQYCDQLLLLHKGRLLAVGTPEQVLQEQMLKDVFKLECKVGLIPGTRIPRVDFCPSGIGL